MTKQVLQQALDALVWEVGSEPALYAPKTAEAIKSLRSALSQHDDKDLLTIAAMDAYQMGKRDALAQQGEPVAWACWFDFEDPKKNKPTIVHYEPVAYSQRRPLTYAEAAPAVQPVAGWQLVPVEPTPQMLAALWAYKQDSLADCYRAMLAAAPAAQPTCKQDLPVETEQERYVRMCPDIECGRNKRCTRMVGFSCMSRADIAPAAEPDWSLLEATQESLCEHMAMVKELRAKLAQQGEQQPVAWRSAVLDLIDDCPGLTMEQDRWLSRRVKELDFPSAPAAQPDARKVIEELLYCVEAWKRGCLHEDYWRDRDDAIQAGQEWLEENK